MPVQMHRIGLVNRADDIRECAAGVVLHVQQVHVGLIDCTLVEDTNDVGVIKLRQCLRLIPRATRNFQGDETLH